MKRTVAIVLTALAVAACGGGSSGSSSTTSPEEQQTGFSASEIAAGRALAAEDGVTDTQGRISYELGIDGLTNECGNPPGQLKIYTDNAEKDLQHHDVEISRLTLMQQVFQANLGEPKESDCAGLFAAYLVLKDR